jgi:hypothetical protein
LAFEQERPALGTKVKTADDNFRSNWSAIENAFNTQHKFDGGTFASAGQHEQGKVSVITVAPTSAVSALGLSAEGGPSVEGRGAIVYDTWTKSFNTWSGSGWTAYDHAKASGDTLTQAWTVGGSFIDGRDPSRDGAKIEAVSVSADDITISHGTATSGASLAVATGYSCAESAIFVHNCGVWSLAPYECRTIACSTSPVPSAGPASDQVGWLFHTQVRDTNGLIHHPDVYFVVVSRRHNP